MSDEILAHVAEGTLRGKKNTSSATGNVFYSFQGIPYAKAPVGPLRFKIPQPPEKWSGIRDALEEGPICPQNLFFSGNFMGKEDNCLCLNVYTKQWPPKDTKPVMVWIHGGAFEMGSGNADMFGPDYLVEEDVIIVTINYRLGVLGFLHVDGTDVAPNVGLRDQVAALKWIKENIAGFGGDENNITIFGVSAGGCSVHFLTLTPLSKGLFQRAIAQSGNALLEFCQIDQDDAKERAFRLGEFLGFESNDAQKLVDFLRTVPEEVLVMSQSKALSDKEMLHAVTCAFVPSVEKSTDGAFLPAPPQELVSKGTFQHVPLITGITSAEGKFALHGLLTCPTLEDVNKQFERSINWNVVRKLNPTDLKTYAEKLKSFYFGESPVHDDTIQQYVDMQSDLIFNFPIYVMVREQVKHSTCPIYYYQFSYRQETSAFDLPFFNKKAEELPGVTHGAEMGLLFHSSLPFAPPGPKSEKHDKARKNIIQLFTNFAKCGNPTVDLDVDWPAVEDGYYPYLDIDTELRVLENINKERMEFLYNLYKEMVIKH